jgi:nucleotide-binding universal stress UspA family protein
MTQLDQFESTFRAAAKETYTLTPLKIDRVLVATDMEAADAAALTEAARRFLAAIDREGTVWTSLAGAAFDSVQALLARVEEHRPDLVITYRHLHSNAWRWPYSLGEHLDVLTQATTTPILVLPHPDADHALPHSVKDTDVVMAITDHLVGDARLVDHALGFTARGGTCWLTHVESTSHFERYIDAISKISMIDTETAAETIKAQLLKEPHDYVRSCRAAIAAAGIDVAIEEIVVMGRRIEEYRRLIEEHEVDLLVMYAKDEDQLAMHGLAYPLAVELRQIPLLML